MEYAGTRLAPEPSRARTNARQGKIDLPFAALTLLVMTIGVVMVHSAS